MRGGVQVFKDLFHFPDAGSGLLYVWSRNFLGFKRSLFSSTFLLVIEPMLYLLAIGFGVGYYVRDIDGVPYLQFYLPALVSTSVMLISFYEGTYGCFNKLHYKKTYEICLRAPISVSELVLGEIAWAATKGFLSAVFISLFAMYLGLLQLDSLGAFLIIQLILSWLFGALGMLLTSFAKNFEFFNYLQIGVVLPMALCSGTYFPMDRMPDWIHPVIYLSPLTHGVSAGRTLLLGQTNSFLFLNLAVLFAISVVLTNWCNARYQRELLQ